MSEFVREFDARHLPGAPVELSADRAECAALATRFGLVAIDRLEAKVTLVAEGTGVRATGSVQAEVVQACAVSAEDLPVRIAEPLALRFVPAEPAPDGEIEIELSAEDCDEIAMDGTRFDLGEAVAQTLALAIDPFAKGPEAEAARTRSGLLGEREAGPFAALAGLRRQADT